MPLATPVTTASLPSSPRSRSGIFERYHSCERLLTGDRPPAPLVPVPKGLGSHSVPTLKRAVEGRRFGVTKQVGYFARRKPGIGEVVDGGIAASLIEHALIGQTRLAQ